MEDVWQFSNCCYNCSNRQRWIKNLVNPREHSSIIYGGPVQSRHPMRGLQGARHPTQGVPSRLWNFKIKASLITSHVADFCHSSDLTKTKIVNHTNKLQGYLKKRSSATKKNKQQMHPITGGLFIFSNGNQLTVNYDWCRGIQRHLF